MADPTLSMHVNDFQDFTNYQYTIQNIPGLVIHTVGKKTTILAPRNRYELVSIHLPVPQESFPQRGGGVS